MNNFNIGKDENESAYILRVCDAKDSIGNWEDVTKILNDNLGTAYSSCTYRKRYTTFKKMYEELLPVLSKSAVEEETQLKIALENLKNERYKLQETKRELDRQMRHNARMELLYENISGAVESFNHTPLSVLITNDDDSVNEYLLTISDVHYGATFSSCNNEYSREICWDRMNKLLSNVCSFCEDNNVHKLHIASLGDSLQGILRIRDIQVNDIDVVDALVEYAHMIADFINNLSNYCKVVYYHVTAANHTQTRPLGSKASELSGEDLEKIIVNYIRDLLTDNDDVAVIYDDHSDMMYSDICGNKICFLHGHQVKSISDALKDISHLHGIDYDYVIMGHHHSRKEIVVGENDTKNREVIVVPAIVGSDPYSDKLMVGAKSGASIYVFNDKYGHIGTHNFILN